MWQKAANIILRNKISIIVILLSITIVLGFFATKVTLQYEFAKLLPKNDVNFKDYQSFKANFGQDGMVIVIAVKEKDFYNLDNFSNWYDMGLDLKNLSVPVYTDDGVVKVNAIDSIFSEAHLYNLYKNKENNSFDLRQVVKRKPQSQAELDSIKKVVNNLDFYKGILSKEASTLHSMMIFINKDIFNSKNRGNLTDDIKKIADKYLGNFTEVHFSGLPFIRSVTMNKVKAELLLFVALAMLVTSLLLFFFFKSFKVVLISMIVVFIGVIWSFGTIGLIGFEISILMGLIPPLVIVIGIPNCVYLINKYHQEYKTHGNKAKSLSRVIQKVGNAAFMTNATTAMGFGTFIFTHSDMMKEFGIIASINILCMFFISILLVPIIFTYMSPPSLKHTKHLDRKWLYSAVDKLVLLVTSYRTAVYIVTVILIVVGAFGMSMMHTTGNVVDDLPKSDQVVRDLKFFEKELNGVMPFEIVLESKDTIYKNFRNIANIQILQEELSKEKYLSKSISIVDAMKYLSSAYANGNSEKYNLNFRNNKDKKYFARVVKSKYFKNTFNNSKSENRFISSFIDSTHKKTRITIQVADVGTRSMDSLMDRVSYKIDSIFNYEQGLCDLAINSDNKDSIYFEIYKESNFVKSHVQSELTSDDFEEIMEFPENYSQITNKYSVNNFNKFVKSAVDKISFDSIITGSGIIYTKGTTYLINNLFISLMIAICVIAIIMSFLFRAWRMVIVSLVPNLIPLLLTSAVMGYFNIAIKPSTILVFSIAFGISIDDTIHFLAKYRQELKITKGDISKSVIMAIKETGISMIYTSIILFFGFSIFIASNFGGTQALGILVSLTLFTAMLSNLVLLPSLLLTLEKLLTTKAFRDSIYEFVIDDEDIELEDLKIIK